MSFTNLGLKPELLSAITARGYKIATPIQAKSIPPVLKGRDVMAGAQTGTGKTAAFSLPILQILSASPKNGRNPRALILTPTRELAAQVQEFIEEYGKSLTLRSTAIFGGVSPRPQISKLKQGIDIIVATPGRLLDHARQNNLTLSEIEILVLDEADRMMDMGFTPDLKKIIKLIPQKRQNLLFSATYTPEIKRMADSILKNPILIEVATRNTTADTVAQVVHPVKKDEKQKLLSKLIRDGNWEQTLVFTRTKHGANNLVKALLKDGISATAIHGNKSQGARTSALAEFKSGQLRVLVATDIAARGLDINLLPHVVNYELSDTPENYIHRIGRTGRAGADGKAVSLVCPEDNYELHAVHKLLKRKIPIERIEGFDANILTTPGRPKGNGRQNIARKDNSRKSNNRKKYIYAAPDTKNSGKPKTTRQTSTTGWKTDEKRKDQSAPNTANKTTSAKPKKPGKKAWRYYSSAGHKNPKANRKQQRPKARC